MFFCDNASGFQLFVGWQISVQFHKIINCAWRREYDAVDFRQVYMFVEAEDEQTLARAKEFARTLTDNVREASVEVRKRIHLCGVFGSNFVNNMYSCAAQVLADAALPFDVVAPVIAETAAKALASHSPASIQTGPAARGDVATMERHRELMFEGKRWFDLVRTSMRKGNTDVLINNVLKKYTTNTSAEAP